jgi:hypothetical protein
MTYNNGPETPSSDFASSDKLQQIYGEGYPSQCGCNDSGSLSKKFEFYGGGPLKVREIVNMSSNTPVNSISDERSVE